MSVASITYAGAEVLSHWTFFLGTSARRLHAEYNWTFFFLREQLNWPSFQPLPSLFPHAQLSAFPSEAPSSPQIHHLVVFSEEMCGESLNLVNQMSPFFPPLPWLLPGFLCFAAVPHATPGYAIHPDNDGQAVQFSLFLPVLSLRLFLGLFLQMRHWQFHILQHGCLNSSFLLVLRPSSFSPPI